MGPPAAGLEVGIGLAQRPGDLGCQRTADGPFGQRLPGKGEGTVVAPVVPHQHRHPGCLGALQDGVGIGDRRRQRLLHEDGEARFHRLERQFAMGMVGCGQKDAVGTGVNRLRQGLEMGGVQFRADRAAFPRGVHDPGERHVPARRDQPCMAGADEAGTGDEDPGGTHRQAACAAGTAKRASGLPNTVRAAIRPASSEHFAPAPQPP